MKISGIYAPAQKRTRNSISNLNLNSDSTFIYSIYSELQIDTFSGNWHVIKDTLLLKITNPINDDSLLKTEKVIGKKNPLIGSGKNKLSVLVQDSVPFTISTIFINNNQTPISLDSHGEAIVDYNITNVKIQSQNIKPRVFKINSAVNNDFTIFLYDKEFIPINYLSPVRKWMIQKGKLLPLDENNKPFKNEIYKKQ